MRGEEAHPFVRTSTICPVCEREKAAGSLWCLTCQTTRRFSEIVQLLDGVERSLRWDHDRKPDRRFPPRATDPELGACPICSGVDLWFMRFEAAGRVAGDRVTPIVSCYVQCRSCRAQTLPRSSKRLAANAWDRGGREIFVGKT
jgi:hypothetical protein